MPESARYRNPVKATIVSNASPNPRDDLMRTLLILLSVASITACGGQSCEGAGCGATTPSPTSESVQGEAVPEAEPEAPVPLPDPGPVPTLAIESRDLHLHLRNTGAENTRFRATAEFRSQGGDGLGEVQLKAACESENPCTTLAPGAEIVMPFGEGSRCFCGDCGITPSGGYELHIESCAPEGNVPHEVVLTFE